ncbi:ATP-dependent 26S proteasome regulatory subunit [Chryseobacterium rhizosphaerae]|nr:ATP-dependent 26S proteasome regulatory subunit [Chryseobacterium rhizosphaerae]MDR6546724.1 ATP-dependent 26S proteasome regulatory subunit [Chryseobacterium rhizosphaerae]
MRVLERGIYLIDQCEVCGHYNYHFPCNNHKMEYVKIKHRNNTLHLGKQCLNCGLLEGKALPKNTVENFENLPLIDEKLIKIREEGSSVREIFEELHNYQAKVSKESIINNFFIEHSKYLQSSKWKEKRTLVLKRDNYVCQSCLQETATEVHHKSYKFWKNEPLFDLISVCKNCHTEITRMSREGNHFLNF